MATDDSTLLGTANWRRRATVLVFVNCVLAVLVFAGLRSREVTVAQAAMAPTPLPARPTPTATAMPTPTPTAVPCPASTAVAEYSVRDGRLRLQGAIHPDDADAFIKQLEAVVDPSNITDDYVRNECVPPGADSVVRIQDGILFEYDSAVIRPEFEPVLDLAAVFVEQFPVTMTVEGHTDSDGTADYNLELSSQRAQAAVDYLIDNGVDRARVDSRGFGASQPIDTNDTEAGKERNRRIEFRIKNTETATSVGGEGS